MADDVLPPFADDDFSRVLVPRVMLPAITRFAGRSAGVANAITFRAVDFQAPPPGVSDMFADATG